MSDRNGNENCLQGYACPKCGNHETLWVEATTMIELSDMGTGDHEDIVWDDKSQMECRLCNTGGSAGVFAFDSPEKRAMLAEEVYKTLAGVTNNMEMLGRTAGLMVAIMRGQTYGFHAPLEDEEEEFLQLVEMSFPLDHPVHKIVEIEEEEEEADDWHDWRYEVTNGDTKLNFPDWVQHRKEDAAHDAEQDGAQ